MFQGGMDPFHGTLTISIQTWNGLMTMVLLLIANQIMGWAHSMIHKPLSI
jgi:hypothetical protein